MKRQQVVRYGWKPDLPDHRDLTYAARRSDPLPKLIDVRGAFPPIQDQLDLGSCTGHAIAGALGALHHKAHFSRLFIYYQERVIERTVDQDAGAQIRDGIKACAKFGAPHESYWPYDTAKFAHAPPRSAMANADLNLISRYARATGLNALRAALAQMTPVVFGFTVYESFESERVALSGKMPMPGKHEGMIGGHAVCAVGYDDARKVVICRNSWGEDWGDKGHFYMPYDYVDNRDLSDDFWAIRK